MHNKLHDWKISRNLILLLYKIVSSKNLYRIFTSVFLFISKFNQNAKYILLIK